MIKIYAAGLIGYEAACELVKEHREETERRFSRAFLKEFEKLGERKQEIIRAVCTDSDRMHSILYRSSVGEGGLTGTLWRACEELEQRLREAGTDTAHSRIGLRVNAEEIPLRQEIIEIMELYDENPYEAPSEGAFLFLCEEEEEPPVPQARVIGFVTYDRKRILVCRDFSRYLTPPERQKKDTDHRKEQGHGTRE